jgi:hypothetical protein
MSIAPDLTELLPLREAASEPDDRPVYYLWTFDPVDGKIHIDHNEGRPAHAHVTHATLAPHVTHPERVHGYAYSIKGGWRITDADHKKVDDPFVIKRVLAALKQEHPPAPLPHVRYHGSPHA